jgi:hypothetical protein
MDSVLLSLRERVSVINSLCRRKYLAERDEYTQKNKPGPRLAETGLCYCCENKNLADPAEVNSVLTQKQVVVA